MAFSVIQAGTSLQLMDTDGGLTTLTLPTGITLRDDLIPRMTTYGRYVIIVNTPSRPITVDVTGTVRPLTPIAPGSAPVLSAGAAGTLSGTYKSRETFTLFDASGRLLGESDFSPTSNTVTIANKFLTAASLETSIETISGRRVYRTTTGTDTYFIWIDVDGNVITTISDDLSDAGLSTLAAPALGSPPHLTLIAEFRDRLFGVGDVDVDTLRYTETAAPWAWPDDNEFQIPHVGEDTVGITALMNRQDALGIGKLNRFLKLTGTSNTDFRVLTLSENCGVISQESVGTFKNVVYFLWHDGVYQWQSDTLTCISDKTNVRSWFASNDYFDRERFGLAFARIDPVRGKYRLYLVTPDLTRQWVEYDLNTQKWYGPHQTSAFVPKSAFTLYTGNNRPYLAVGSDDAGVYVDSDKALDVNMAVENVAIELDVDTAPMRGDDPDLTHYWGLMTVVGKAQDEDVAGELTITPTVGDLGATAGNPLTYDMSKSRQKVGRPGIGRLLQLNLSHAVDADEPVEIYGIELSDVAPIGSR